MKTIESPTWQLRTDQEVYRPTHRHGLNDDRTYVVVHTRWGGPVGPEGLDLYETADYCEALELVHRERERIRAAGIDRGWAVIDTRYADGCRHLAWMDVRERDDPVRSAWRALPYQGHTFCRTCGQSAFCAGINPDSRVCIGCFEFAHSCRAPNYRRRRKSPCG